MKNTITPFTEPIYVTRPVLPDLTKVMEKMKEIWDCKWLTNWGPQQKELENSLLAKLKVPYLSLFNNGTTALLVACRSLRLTGEVITTPFTFAATTHALAWNNLKPVFADIDPCTLNLDPKKIEKMISAETSAIMPVHVFGTPCDVKEIQKIADHYGLKVIYDAAHAFGVEIDDIGIGNFGDISMFSFHATKLFHTIEGGALTYNCNNLKNRIDLLKNFGIKNEEEVAMVGINGKINEVQASIGLLVLEKVEEERKKRKILVDEYRRRLKEIKGIDFPDDLPGVKNTYQYFVIRINEDVFGKSRDYVYAKLKDYNVFARKYFYPLCSQFNCYSQFFSAAPEKLPVATKVAKEVLAMPLYGELVLADVQKICDIVESFR